MMMEIDEDPEGDVGDNEPVEMGTTLPFGKVVLACVGVTVVFVADIIEIGITEVPIVVYWRDLVLVPDGEFVGVVEDA